MWWSSADFLHVNVYVREEWASKGCDPRFGFGDQGTREKDVLNILVDKTGKVFMSMDNQTPIDGCAFGMTGQYGVS